MVRSVNRLCLAELVKIGGFKLIFNPNLHPTALPICVTFSPAWPIRPDMTGHLPPARPKSPIKSRLRYNIGRLTITPSTTLSPVLWCFIQFKPVILKSRRDLKAALYCQCARRWVSQFLRQATLPSHTPSEYGI